MRAERSFLSAGVLDGNGDRAAGHRELTTQIYFAGEPANASDGAILPSLTIELATDLGGALSGAFDVVLGPL